MFFVKQPVFLSLLAKETILGWIDNSALQNIGTGLHIDLAKVKEDSIKFLIRENLDTVPLSSMHVFENQLLSTIHPIAKYNPISSFKKNAIAESSFRVGLPLSIFDRKDNFIFNINGGSISYLNFSKIATDLKKINIAFVFDGREQTIEQFPQIVNALQSLQPIFDENTDKFVYNFSCVLNFFDNKEKKYQRTPIMNVRQEPEYSSVINYLTDKATNQAHLAPLLQNNPWSGLYTAVNSFNYQQKATNLIVVIGEKGFPNNSFTKEFMEQVHRNNCRILAFQPFAGEDNSYNNFVLNMESLISSYAESMLKSRGDILVSPKQTKKDNFYVDVSEEAGNSFRLDFPDNSITEGYILFPSKGGKLPMNVLATSIDTMLQQIRLDNNNVIKYINKAFTEVGNNRTKFDSIYQASYGIAHSRKPMKKTVQAFKNNIPGWYLPTEMLSFDMNKDSVMHYKLLLSELEMKEMKEFVEALSSIETDFKYRADAKKKVTKNPCNCPDDEDLFLRQNEISNLSPEDINNPEYANTKKVRKNIYNLHIKHKLLKLCKDKKKNLEKMTIAELQERITGMSTSNVKLNSITVKDIKNKKKVTDKELDALIQYYKSKVGALNEAETVESNSETYYWVDKKNLP